VAAPIYNDQERLVGCIGLSAPIFSFDLNDVDTYGQMIREAGEKSSVDLGYTSQTIVEKGDAYV
jgi:DNA-binding IclR family transcriptional regulator